MDDVIVIGAGPGGNNAAYNLALRGYNVTVIERKSLIGSKLCTGIVGAECLRKFPIDNTLVMRAACRANLVSPSGIVVELNNETPQAHIIDRVSYVASFAEKARAMGVNYLLGSNVTDIVSLPDLMQVSVDGANGNLIMRAKAIIIAEGFGSRLTQKIGLGGVGDFTTGIQAEVTAPELEQVQVYFGRDVAPDFFAWLVPTLSDKALVGLMARRHSHQYLEKFIDKLRQENMINEVVKKPTSWGVPLQPIARTFGHRVLIVGDAAGQVKPTTGGGIYYSLLAGAFAAESLHMSFVRGDFSESQLSVYEKLWKDFFSREMGIGVTARQFFELLKDGQMNSLMYAIASDGIRADILMNGDLSFDWHATIIRRVLEHRGLRNSLKFLNPVAIRLAARMIAG